eukprot:CAMPEP_0196654704 /NCGR_PEP_ID=MMETSP1086-20130531/4426_1 /TAXON_ID=77921 /ORGANISM="Cyanoptyche  gloeocystis , Strain SAG4.97" /LENGTH=170 /DNA_ID=CAMNT_0041986613 /DNA_START=85 /DNA_END=597 /DNA_ORIENTATION=-
MIIYKDVFTGDEMISDSFKLKETEEGVVWEVEGKSISIGVGDINIGANASAEGDPEDEGVADEAQKAIDIVYSFRLQETQFDKKSFTLWLKGYMKKVKEYLEKNNASRVEPFQKGAQAYAKKLLGMYDNLQFFLGEQMEPEAGIAMAYYAEGASNPTFIFFKDGLKEYKV